MKRLVYLHGFASSPAGRKAAALAQLLPEFEIAAPDLNAPSFDRLDFDAMVGRAIQAVSPAPDVLVGSSLGALVALAVSRRMPATPLLLLAPASYEGVKLPARRSSGVRADEHPRRRSPSATPQSGSHSSQLGPKHHASARPRRRH